MKYRDVVLCAALVAVASVAMAGQAPKATQSTAAPTKSSYTPPRTAWGDPDLQGLWRAQGLPLERPKQYEGREGGLLTDAEVATRVSNAEKLAALRLAGKVEARGFRANPNVNDIFVYTGEKPRVSKRTSGIVDPPDGRLPAWTLEAVKVWEAREAATSTRGEADSPLDRTTNERCIVTYTPPTLSNWGLEFAGGTSNYGGRFSNLSDEGGTSFMDGLDSSTRGARDVKILQAPGYVALVDPGYENYRIIPLNKPVGLSKGRTYNGTSTAHFEGNTLVVEVTNVYFDFPVLTGYFGGADYPGTGETLKVIERYTPIDANNIEFRYTVIDPKVYTRPYTAQVDMTRNDSYQDLPGVCHENNLRDMGGIYNTARADEFQAIENDRDVQRERDTWFQMRKKQAMEAANKQSAK